MDSGSGSYFYFWFCLFHIPYNGHILYNEKEKKF